MSDTIAPAITAPELAQRFGVSPDKVRHWIATGELRAVNVVTDRKKRPVWRITPQALEAFEAARAAVPPATKPPLTCRQKLGDVREFF